MPTRRQRIVGYAAVVLAWAALCLTGCNESPCGQGSELRDGACRASASGCGVGTELINGECRPSTERCGDGLVVVAGVCQPEASVCGEGTTFDTEQQRCVIDAEIVCGEHTRLDEDGQCVADVCGDKTVLNSDGRCVVGAPSCGEDTVLDPTTGRCEADGELCVDGAEYVEARNACVPTGEICGERTRFDEDLGLCLPNTCRPGDVLSNNVCVTPAEELAAAPDATSAENDDPALGGTASELELGEPGDPESVLVGVIEPAKDIDDDGQPDQDRDVFTFDAPAGAWVDIVVQSTGIPGAAFVVEGPKNYRRYSSFGPQMTTARRILTPYAGRYEVAVVPHQWAELTRPPSSPSETLETFGDEAWSYVATIQRQSVEWPRPRILPEEGTLEVGQSLSISPARHSHAALQYTDPRPTRGDSLQATAFSGDGDGHVTDIGSSDVDVLYANGAIEHIYFDRVYPEDQDGRFSGRVAAPADVGRLSGTRDHYEASALRNPVYRLEVPARSVVEFGHTIGADARFSLHRGGAKVISDVELGEDERVTAVAGDADEVWYAELWENDLRAASWAIRATPQWVTDLGALDNGSVGTKVLATSCGGEVYAVLSAIEDTHLLATGWITDGVTNEIDVFTSSRHRISELYVTADHFFTPISAGEVVALRTSCSASRNAKPAVRYSVRPQATSDLGSLPSGSAGWHSIGGIRAGEAVEVSFDAPADHVIRVAHSGEDFDPIETTLTNAAGDVLLDDGLKGTDAQTAGKPSRAMAVHGVAGGRYTLELTSDFERQGMQVYVALIPTTDLGTVTPDATVSLNFDYSVPRKEVQTWRFTLTGDAIMTFDPIDLDARLGDFELVSATTGEVELAKQHMSGDRIAIPLRADTWFFRITSASPSPFDGVGLKFHAATVDMRHMECPRGEYEPVRWRLPVQCAGTVDNLRVTIRRRDIIASPYVDLVAPDGTRVALHRDERRNVTDRTTGYQLPDVLPYESLAPLYGVPATGDWTLWMYTPTIGIDEIFAVGLEVSCAP